MQPKIFESISYRPCTFLQFPLKIYLSQLKNEDNNYICKICLGISYVQVKLQPWKIFVKKYYLYKLLLT